MKFAILHTIAFLMVALTIIPQNSVAPTHDKQDITQILESVKFIDDYTNKYTGAKHSEDRDKQKVYQLSINELREKIKESHPEYEHTLADTIQKKIDNIPSGMHPIGGAAQCYWAAKLREVTKTFEDQLNLSVPTGSSFETLLDIKLASTHPTHDFKGVANITIEMVLPRKVKKHDLSGFWQLFQRKLFTVMGV